ncbi:hypothetical protein DMN91_004019 [Ooceraea biroi]|uniref:Uncharacterized protein n=1 Tax=Ooceraea biroi TaxID=2015173 RepID=A0A3L8DTV7_OOCBI|nr:hypothetical protein DMN91_004019 [Ooceraea biroi]
MVDCMIYTTARQQRCGKSERDATTLSPFFAVDRTESRPPALVPAVHRDYSHAPVAIPEFASESSPTHGTNSANFGWLTRRAYAATTKDSRARQVRFAVANLLRVSFSNIPIVHMRRNAPRPVDAGTSGLPSDREMRLAARYGERKSSACSSNEPATLSLRRVSLEAASHFVEIVFEFLDVVKSDRSSDADRPRGRGWSSVDPLAALQVQAKGHNWKAGLRKIFQHALKKTRMVTHLFYDVLRIDYPI